MSEDMHEWVARLHRENKQAADDAALLASLLPGPNGEPATHVVVERLRIDNLAKEMGEGWCVDGGMGEFHDCYGCKIKATLTSRDPAP